MRGRLRAVRFHPYSPTWCWTNWTGSWSGEVTVSCVTPTTVTSTSAANERATSDGERYLLHHEPTQVQGESGEERRGPTRAKEVSRIQLHLGTSTEEADRP